VDVARVGGVLLGTGLPNVPLEVEVLAALVDAVLLAVSLELTVDAALAEVVGREAEADNDDRVGGVLVELVVAVALLATPRVPTAGNAFGAEVVRLAATRVSAALVVLGKVLGGIPLDRGRAVPAPGAAAALAEVADSPRGDPVEILESSLRLGRPGLAPELDDR
jgi:hypothetical protein